MLKKFQNIGWRGMLACVRILGMTWYIVRNPKGSFSKSFKVLRVHTTRAKGCAYKIFVLSKLWVWKFHLFKFIAFLCRISSKMFSITRKPALWRIPGPWQNDVYVASWGQILKRNLISILYNFIYIVNFSWQYYLLGVRR